MGKVTIVAGVLLTSAFATAPAIAQREGFYVGETEDGNQIAIGIAQTDGGFGLFSLTIQYRARCRGDHRKVQSGAGFTFPENVIRHDHKRFGFTILDNVHSDGELAFVDDNTIKGTIFSSVAALGHGDGKKPDAAEYCISKKQGFTATFSGPAHRGSMLSDTNGLHQTAGILRWVPHGFVGNHEAGQTFTWRLK